MAARKKYYEVIKDADEEQDLSLIPVRITGLPFDLVEECNDLSTVVYSIKDDGEVGEVSVFWLKPSSRAEMLEKKKESKNLYTYGYDDEDDYVFFLPDNDED